MPTGFHLSIYELFLRPDIKGLNGGRYLSWFFNAVILKGLSFCIFFQHCQLNTKLQKSHPNAVIESLAKLFNVNVTTLCWRCVDELVSRVEPEHLVVFDNTLLWKWVCVYFNQFDNCDMKDSKINTINTTCYLEMFNTLLIKWAGVYYIKNIKNILKDIKNKHYFLIWYRGISVKGLCFIECCCAMTLSNLLECWLCDNVDLVLLWISRVFGTKRQCMMVFSKKNIE